MMIDLRLTNARLTTSRPLIANPIRVLANFCAGASSYFAEFLRARRSFSNISSMDDAQLRDIGLFRGDVITASMLSGESDPTLYLARVSKQGRDLR